MSLLVHVSEVRPWGARGPATLRPWRFEGTSRRGRSKKETYCCPWRAARRLSPGPQAGDRLGNGRGELPRAEGVNRPGVQEPPKKSDMTSGPAIIGNRVTRGSEQMRPGRPREPRTGSGILMGESHARARVPGRSRRGHFKGDLDRPCGVDEYSPFLSYSEMEGAPGVNDPFVTRGPGRPGRRRGRPGIHEIRKEERAARDSCSSRLWTSRASRTTGWGVIPSGLESALMQKMAR